MSCCGRRREALRKPQVRWARAPSQTTSPSGAALPGADAPRVEVRFVGRGGYLVAGPATREIYRFSAQAPRAFVDARDLPDLLRTGLFEVAER